MGGMVFIDMDCPGCRSHVGDNYTVNTNGQHTQAKCANCGSHIKFLSKEDKYGTQEQQKAVWAKTKGRCCYCGKSLVPFEKNGYSYEHLVPQNSGGGHETENLYPCCKSCNSQKGKKELEQYREYMTQKTGLKKYVFYFEVVEFSPLGELLKAMF